MGCGASAPAEPSSASPARPIATASSDVVPPEDKPMETWSTQEVSGWFGTLAPELQKYRSALLPTEGRKVAKWAEQDLVGCGVSGEDAARIVAYRNLAASRAAPAPQVAAAPAAGLPALPGLPVRAGTQAQAAPSKATSAVIQTPSLTDPAPEPRGGRARALSAPARQPLIGRLAPPPQGPERDAQQPAPPYSASPQTMVPQGVDVTRAAVAAAVASLPVPVDQAAVLVLALLDLMRRDVPTAGTAKMRVLWERAVAVLDIFACCHSEMGAPQYRRVATDFIDLLEDMLSYVRAYTGRENVVRMLAGGGEAAHYQGLLAGLEAVRKAAMAHLSVDSDAHMQELQDSVEAERRGAANEDPPASARALVSQLGGLEAVAADRQKLQSVVQQLDVMSAGISLETAATLLASHLDKGPQRHIRRADLRLFWRQECGAEAELPWPKFWEKFPGLLADTGLLDSGVVAELGALLADDAARNAFRINVEDRNKGTVSVSELDSAFGEGEGLIAQVTAAIATPGSGTFTRRTAGGPCTLPQTPAHYRGRDAVAVEIEEHLLTQGSLVLLGSGGRGKSCLAADVGWRLVRGDKVPGGAVWVDLREASSVAEMEARFCSALGMETAMSGSPLRIVDGIRRLTSFGGQPALALVVVDGVEDALAQEETAGALRTLLGKVTLAAPGARLLVTSRRMLGPLIAATTDDGSDVFMEKRPVDALSASAATQLVRAVAVHLPEQEAARVAEACCCVPLLLCLVARALAAGRLSLEDLPKLAAKEGATDAVAPAVAVVLAGLKQQHQLALAQLAILPASFDEQAVSAVLATTQTQARGLLAALLRQGLVWRMSSERYTFHPSVRQQAALLGPQLDAALQGAAEGRLVARTLSLLGEWSAQYSTKGWRVGMLAARDTAADIGALLDLLSSPTNTSWNYLTVIAGFTGALPQFARAAGLSTRLLAVCDNLAKKLDASPTKATVEHQLSVANLLFLQSRIRPEAKEGEADARRSVELRNKVLGADHGDSAASLGSLADCVARQGRHGVAEELFKQALEKREKAFGADDAEAGYAMVGLGDCLRAKAQYEEAEVQYNAAIELRRRLLGDYHPESATALGALADNVRSEGRFSANAEPLYRQVLALRQQVLGADHPDTAAAQHALAVCVNAGGRGSVAEPLFRAAHDLRQRVLGEEHPSTTESLVGLANCLGGSLGRNAEAEPLFRAAVRTGLLRLGRDHANTKEWLKALGVCVRAQGMTFDAEDVIDELMAGR